MAEELCDIPTVCAWDLIRPNRSAVEVLAQKILPMSVAFHPSGHCCICRIYFSLAHRDVFRGCGGEEGEQPNAIRKALMPERDTAFRHISRVPPGYLAQPLIPSQWWKTLDLSEAICEVHRHVPYLLIPRRSVYAAIYCVPALLVAIRAGISLNRSPQAHI